MSAERHELWAWVTDEAERRRHEAELRRLAGRRIERVRYVEIRYEEPPAPAWPGELFDSLDFGVEIDLDNGETWSCTWQQEGHNEGVLVSPTRLASTPPDPDSGTAVWDVTDRWRELGPTVIADVTSQWTRFEYGPAYVVSTGEQVEEAGESDLCQLVVVLHSHSEDGRKTVLTLGDRHTDGTYAYNHENVAVFFSIADAQAAGVWLEPRSLAGE